MTDEPELPLAGLDAERPLPPELRARLESALLAALADGLPVPADAESLDAPRPLPEPLRTRLESALLAEAAAPGAGAASNAPSPQPAAASAAPPSADAPASTAAAAGTVVSLQSRRRKVVAWWSAVAAVLVFILGAAGLVSINGGGGSEKVEVANAPTTTTAGTPVSLPSDAGSSADPAATSTTAGSPASTGPAATATTRGGRPVRPSPPTTAPPAPSSGPPAENAQPAPMAGTPTSPGGGGTQPAPMQPGGSTYSPPPFYDSAAPSGDAASPPAMSAQPSPSAGSSPQGGTTNENSKSGAPATAAPPLRVGVIPGDAAQEAGFRAYIDRLNSSGGIRGSSIQLVNVGPGSPAANTIATVNLGTLPVAGPGGAPSWATGPLLETLTATENLLRGGGAVFSFASVPERQGHLAADALFPTKAAAGTKAVIYTAASGPLRDAVPGAMRAVLEQRGVGVEVVVFDPTRRPARFEPADAALLSLDPSAAKAWLAEARSANHRPAAGIAGIYSLADDTLLADLPEGARVVSPYVAPGGDEGQAIRSGAGGTSASVLHGWATAKSVAAAIWRTGADTPAELQAALEGLTDWSSGLAPRYETRPNTRSRTPEGVVFRVQSQAFVADGGFRRDPH